jgi:hypothetical protein
MIEAFKMNDLSKRESDLLVEFKEAIAKGDTLNRIVTANYLLNEIEYQFGVDVLEFVVGYQAGLLKLNYPQFKGEIPTLVKVGDEISCGYGKFSDEIKTIMIEKSDVLAIRPGSSEAASLTGAVERLVNSEKRPWIEIYNTLNKEGDLK